jgi:uncharacterized protein (DUF302 family)
VINHYENAKKIDVDMNEATLIIFGNPKIGTKLMKDNIESSIDLPLKILVYKDADQNVKVAYRDGAWLKKQHKLNVDKATNKMSSILDMITNKATK